MEESGADGVIGAIVPAMEQAMEGRWALVGGSGTCPQNHT
jgi:hypothetical protein